MVTFCPNNSPKRAATGVKLMLSTTLPLGRPMWLQRITFAPLLINSLMVGKAARIRVSSVMLPLSKGTLKSTLTNTRFPARSAADKLAIVFLDTVNILQ